MVSVSVFMSLKVTAAVLPPRVAVVVLWKPLPRMVITAPPAVGPDAGVSVPMPSGTFASCTMLRPLVVRAKSRWPFSSVVRNCPCRPSMSVFSMAKASGR